MPDCEISIADTFIREKTIVTSSAILIICAELIFLEQSGDKSKDLNRISVLILLTTAYGLLPGPFISMWSIRKRYHG